MLAAVGSAGMIATAGCTGLRAETISNPTEERTSNGETSVQFHADTGDRVTTLTIRPGKNRYSGHSGQQIPVDIALTHPETTTVTDVRFSLRAPPSGAGAPAEVAVETPFGTPYPSLDLYASPDDGATVLAIDDMGENGEGTVLFKFLLTGLREATSELAISAEVGLEKTGILGQVYTLKESTLVPIPDGSK